MARQGRELELLVAQLEHLFGAGTLAVRSPEIIPNRHNGKPVEVDVTLRGSVGSTEVLIALECRDRNAKQGINWIRELATKRDDVGASAIVAVSRTGFTADAIAEARTRNVVLKQLARVSPSEVADALLGVRLDVRRARWELRAVTNVVYREFFLDFRHPPLDLAPETVFGLIRKWKEPGVFDELERRPASFEDMLMAADWSQAFAGLSDGEHRLANVEIPCSHTDEFGREEGRYRWLLEDGAGVTISALTIQADVWYQPETAAMSSVFEYSADDGLIARVAEFDMTAHGQPGKVVQLFLGPPSG